MNRDLFVIGKICKFACREIMGLNICVLADEIKL